MENEIEPGRYGCPACKERFTTLGDKRRHLRTEHQEDES